MKFVICNAFSINMLERRAQEIKFIPINRNAATNLLRNENYEPAIGHENTAVLVANDLDVEANLFNRMDVTLDQNTSLIVAQHRGPRLAEGATTLPEGASIEYWQVYLAY